MLAYYATISHLDHQVGELIAELKRLNLYENTVIVFLSDNGYHLGNHGLGNKITMHEESVRVPMFIVAPGRFAHGARCGALVSSLDVLPTLVELAGAEPPQALMGRSLVPLLADSKKSVRDHVVSECIGVGGKPGQGHRMVRSDTFKYVLTDTSEEWLFDETQDPYELTNLATRPEHRATLRQLRQHLRNWMSQTGDTHAPPPAE